MRKAIYCLTFGALLLALAPASTRAEVIRIRIENLAFAPQRVAARIGDVVEWTNGDFVAHTATARNGAWDLVIPPNATRRIVLKTGGAVDYYCRYHPGMTGRITVVK